MYATGLHFDVLLVFFVYGLAFVLMGLAIALESGRTPALAGKGLLHPLAALELFLMQIVWFGETYPTWTGWFRVVLLTASFIALIIYGIEAFRLPRHRLEANSIVYLGVLFIYLVAVLTAVALTGRPEGQSDFGFYDTLVRYFMAVPGAALAGWGLRAQPDGPCALGQRGGFPGFDEGSNPVGSGSYGSGGHDRGAAIHPASGGRAQAPTVGCSTSPPGGPRANPGGDDQAREHAP
jgi:hypothetical protein